MAMAAEAITAAAKTRKKEGEKICNPKKYTNERYQPTYRCLGVYSSCHHSTLSLGPTVTTNSGEYSKEKFIY
jgi:hypothetical protein